MDRPGPVAANLRLARGTPPGSGCPVARWLPGHPICAIMRGFLPPRREPLPHRGLNGGGLSGRKATSER